MFNMLFCFLEDSKYWKRQAEIDIEKMLAATRYENRAKNVIIFVGDGMGIQTHALARIFKVSLHKDLFNHKYDSIQGTETGSHWRRVIIGLGGVALHWSHQDL